MAELGMAFLNPFAEQQRMDVVDAKLGPEVESLKAMARLHNANAATAEQDAAGKLAAQAFWQKRLGALGQDPNFTGPPAPVDPASLMTDAANLELLQGNTERATGILNQKARMEEQQALQKRFEEMARATKVQETLKKTSWVQQQLGAVTDQASFDDANQKYEELFGEPSPYKNASYTPELVNGIRQASMTAAQRAREAAQTQTIKDREAREARLAADAKVRQDLAARKLADQEARDTRVRKEAGPKTPSVNRKAVEDSVLGTIQGDEVAAALKGTQKLSAMRDLADRAAELLRANSGLNTEMAARQAFAEAKKAGDFDQTGTLVKSSNYVGGGKKATDALPLPPDKVLRPGRWYSTARGPAKWDGKQFTTE